MSEKAIVFVKTLECVEPATSFGDDMDVRVAGKTIQGQFSIDQGQSAHFDFYYPFSGKVTISFWEDSDHDPSADIEVDETPSSGLIKPDVKIKTDGRYILHYRVLDNDEGQKVIIRKNLRGWEKILTSIRNLPDYQDLTTQLEPILAAYWRRVK